jgi:phage terminase large subunit-like protein
MPLDAKTVGKRIRLLRGPQHDTAWCDELAKWSRLKDA